MLKKSINSTIIFCFILTSFGSLPQAQADGLLGLPVPGSMVNLSAAYEPVLIKGLRVHPDNPLSLDFILDTGDSRLNENDPKLKLESQKLIKYFFAALTLPERDVWVNLSPYEKDRIVPKATGQTEMGRDMLAEDYILKQISASLIYPEKGIGKDFWNKVYKEAYERFGTTQVPVNTFNKVWIVADKASVYENGDTVLVVSSHLKVMLEEDYLALTRHENSSSTTSALSSQVIRQIILPALEKEVNEGQNFANLRQIFHSLILAKWYKESLKTALLNQVYSNKAKIGGVDVADKNIKEKIYQRYLQAYKKGVFNYIKEEINEGTQQRIPRKYFSGGVTGALIYKQTTLAQAQQAGATTPRGNFAMASVTIVPAFQSTREAAMTSNATVPAQIHFSGLQEIKVGQEYDLYVPQRRLMPGKYFWSNSPLKLKLELRDHLFRLQLYENGIKSQSSTAVEKAYLWGPLVIALNPYDNKIFNIYYPANNDTGFSLTPIKHLSLKGINVEYSDVESFTIDNNGELQLTIKKQGLKILNISEILKQFGIDLALQESMIPKDPIAGYFMKSDSNLIELKEVLENQNVEQSLKKTEVNIIPENIDLRFILASRGIKYAPKESSNPQVYEQTEVTKDQLSEDMKKVFPNISSFFYWKINLEIKDDSGNTTGYEQNTVLKVGQNIYLFKTSNFSEDRLDHFSNTLLKGRTTNAEEFLGAISITKFNLENFAKLYVAPSGSRRGVPNSITLYSAEDNGRRQYWVMTQDGFKSLMRSAYQDLPLRQAVINFMKKYPNEFEVISIEGATNKLSSVPALNTDDKFYPVPTPIGAYGTIDVSGLNRLRNKNPNDYLKFLFDKKLLDWTFEKTIRLLDQKEKVVAALGNMNYFDGKQDILNLLAKPQMESRLIPYLEGRQIILSFKGIKKVIAMDNPQAAKQGDGLSWTMVGKDIKIINGTGSPVQIDINRAMAVQRTMSNLPKNLVVVKRQTNGGIDFNASRLNLQHQGPGIQMKFNQAMIARFRQGNYDGISAVITRITPIANIYPVLGINSSEKM